MNEWAAESKDRSMTVLVYSLRGPLCAGEAFISFKAFFLSSRGCDYKVLPLAKGAYV